MAACSCPFNGAFSVSTRDVTRVCPQPLVRVEYQQRVCFR